MDSLLAGLLMLFVAKSQVVAAILPSPQEIIVQETPRLLVYMYHYIRVADPKDREGVALSVTPDSFDHQLDELVRAHKHTITSDQIVNRRVPMGSVLLTFDDGYEDFYTEARPRLLRRGMRAAVAIITDKIGQPGYMTADQIIQLHQEGFEIMCHSRSHVDLSTASRERQHDEIARSKSILERLIGARIISFVYPSGKHNEISVEEVAAAQYLHAFTTQPGDTWLDKEAPLLLRRHRIENDTKEMPL